MNRARLAALLPLLGLLLSACLGGSAPPVPQDHYYRLPAASVTSQSRFPHSVAVARFDAQGLHRDRAVLFVDMRRPLELQRYHYHHWTVNPPQLLQEHLLEALRQANPGRQVIRYTPGIASDVVLQGRILRLERVLDGTDIKVAASLEFELRTADNQPLWQAQYSSMQAVTERSMHSSVEAFGTALADIYAAFFRDLEQQLANIPAAKTNSP